MTTKRVSQAVPVPKVKGFPIIGSAIDVKFGFGFHTAFDKWKNIHGDVFNFKVGKQLQMTIVGDADLTEHILSTHKDADNFLKKTIYDNSLGEYFHPDYDVYKHGQLGVITAHTNNPVWKYARKKTEEGIMKAKVIEKSVSTIECVGRELVENIRTKHQFEDDKKDIIIVSDVGHLMNMAALDVISTIVFGECFNSLKGKDHPIATSDRILFQTLTKIIADPIKSWKWAPQAFHPSYWTRCVNGVIEKKVYIDQLIEKGKKDLAAGKEPDCMLENFLANGAEEIFSDTKSQFMANLSELVVAGHDTTSNTLSFLLWELAKNPEIQEEIREEIFSLNDDPENSGLDAYKKAKKLNNCIKETLRLWPAVLFTLPREAEKESISDEYIIGSKTSVSICPWILHRNPKYWDDPVEWKPERFTETRRGAHRYSYLPFSAGARNCAGQRLAMTEMRILMSHLLINFRISLTDQTPTHESQFVVLKCINLKLRFESL